MITLTTEFEAMIYLNDNPDVYISDLWHTSPEHYKLYKKRPGKYSYTPVGIILKDIARDLCSKSLLVVADSPKETTYFQLDNREG
jgi:hypothetical protein